MYLHSFCQDKGIAVKNDRDESYPIHSLMGSLSKHYSENENIQSEFSKQALKMSISLFEKYNDLRNKKSYAHDNEILFHIVSIFIVHTSIFILKEYSSDQAKEDSADKPTGSSSRFLCHSNTPLQKVFNFKR